MTDWDRLCTEAERLQARVLWVYKHSEAHYENLNGKWFDMLCQENSEWSSTRVKAKVMALRGEKEHELSKAYSSLIRAEVLKKRADHRLERRKRGYWINRNVGYGP